MKRQPLKAVAYLRVSTDEQSASGLGLEAQREAISQAASRLGLVVSAWHEDAGISGAAPVERRPGLLAALADLEDQGVLLVAKRDRLARDPIVCAMTERLVERKKGRIISASGEGTESDDPTSVLMRRVVDAFAEYERLVIKARTIAALEAKRRRGERCGGNVPFGYRDEGGQWVRDEAEQAVIGQIVAMRLAGTSMSRIAEIVNEAGGTTKKGAAWTHKQISRVIRYAEKQEKRDAAA